MKWRIEKYNHIKEEGDKLYPYDIDVYIEDKCLNGDADNNGYRI